MSDLWSQLHELFDSDDGSFPDILIKNLSSDQVIKIYSWVREQCDVYCKDGGPTFWHREKNCDVFIRCCNNPAQLVIDGRAESFRHGLTVFSIDGVEIPQLTVAVSPIEIGFDYCMGPEWGPKQVSALFKFLWAIQSMVPNAKITHLHEGRSEPSSSFKKAWEEFVREKSAT